MALRGSAKIQLFNAKTGELEKTVESNNLITNAITNIFNGALTALAICDNNNVNGRHENLNILFDFPSGYSLAKSLMGGLLVFSDSIEESADHIIPSVSEMKSFIGCANQGSSIDDYPFTVFTDLVSSYEYDLYKNDLWLKEPWCSFKFAGNGFFNSIEMWSTYLATINNQVSGLVKTSDQTMKITYTLTQS
jgi:hypothetical protein